MKRIIFSLILMASALTLSAQQYYGRVTDPDGYTNIRRGPSTGSAIVRRYNSGEYLYYTPAGNGWSKVYSGARSNTFLGYMHTSRIARVDPNSRYDRPAPRRDNFFSGRITDPTDYYVNIRKGPGTNYAITGRLDIGTFVYYTPTNSNWVKVYSRNKRFLGYVQSSRID